MKFVYKDVYELFLFVTWNVTRVLNTSQFEGFGDNVDGLEIWLLTSCAVGRPTVSRVCSPDLFHQQHP